MWIHIYLDLKFQRMVNGSPVVKICKTYLKKLSVRNADVFFTESIKFLLTCCYDSTNIYENYTQVSYYKLVINSCILKSKFSEIKICFRCNHDLLFIWKHIRVTLFRFNEFCILWWCTSGMERNTEWLTFLFSLVIMVITVYKYFD